jgi:threonine synthase
VIGAKCSRCGADSSADVVLSVCSKCGGALLFGYDFVGISSVVPKSALEGRKDSFWKFVELLPVGSAEDIVSLGEAYTPVLEFSDARFTGGKSVFVKDDGRLPTGTFKARGLSVAVSRLRELGVRHVAVPSAGNAAGAVAAYAARAGLRASVFMPRDVPTANLKECVFLGADVYLVDGLIGDAAGIVKRLKDAVGWFDLSTSKQPYRFEGYKAISFELAEQFGWDLPENIVFPTGGGEGIVGLWKGFHELMELGWIKRVPRLVMVQSSGCAPLVKAFNYGQSEVKELWSHAETVAAGLRVPMPYASYLVLRALRETDGLAVAVDDVDIIVAMRAFFKGGVYACPEAAATLAAYRRLLDDRVLDADERSLLYVTGTALKYFDVMDINRTRIPVLRKDAASLSDVVA